MPKLISPAIIVSIRPDVIIGRPNIFIISCTISVIIHPFIGIIWKDIYRIIESIIVTIFCTIDGFICFFVDTVICIISNSISIGVPFLFRILRECINIICSTIVIRVGTASPWCGGPTRNTWAMIATIGYSIFVFIDTP